MRLLIVSTDTTGRVALVADRIFTDASEASRELAGLLECGEADVSREYYALDLDVAVPVIVLRPGAVADAAALLEQPVEEPYASEVLEQLAAEPEAAVEQPDPVEVPVTEDASEEDVPVLAAVVQADPPATGAEEPVEPVAAEPVADEPADAPAEAGDAAAEADAEPSLDAPPQWPWDVPAAEGEADAGAEAAAEAEAEAPELPTVVPAEVEPAPEEVDPLADLPPLPDLPDVAVHEPKSLSKETLAESIAAFGEQPALEGSPLEPAAAEAPAADDGEDGEDGFGEMADMVAALAETIPAETEPTPLDDLAADIEAFEPEPADDAVAEPLGVIRAAPLPPDPGAAEAAEPTGYEPEPLNMDAYTCDDCVYVNTCPNQHQKLPAECGSFQWRSV